MKDNGTDRDIAQAFVTIVDDLATLLGTLNDNLFVPHITTQPTDQEGEVDGTVTFTVVANNAVSYKWMYRTSISSPTYRDMHSGTTGADTASLTVTVTEARYAYIYRCTITGKDGSEINTNTVHILEPAPEPDPEPVG